MTRYDIKVEGYTAVINIERGNSTGFPASGTLLDKADGILVHTATIIYGGYCHAEIVIKIMLEMLEQTYEHADIDWSDLEPAVADAGLECHCDDDDEEDAV